MIFVGGGGAGAYLKNRDQIINVGMISHASFRRHKGFRGGRGHGLPKNCLKFEVFKLLAGNALKSYHHHVILYHFKYFTISSGRLFWLLL